jgi:hypothetical protein
MTHKDSTQVLKTTLATLAIEDNSWILNRGATK